MHQERLYELIEKYTSGRITSEEEAELMRWYDAHEALPDLTQGFNPQEELRLKGNIRESIEKNIRARDKKSVKVRRLFNAKAIQLAAAVSLLFVLTFVIYRYANESQTIVQTAYGETRTCTLPDNSEVVLNGNSRLSYDREWSASEEPREVWLDGEAFFTVTHQSNHQRFIVHVSDTTQIEVLGTEFNISERGGGTEVALKSGSIKFHIQRPLEKETAPEEILMKPGDVVRLATGQQVQLSHAGEATQDTYYAWKEGRMQLDNTSLSDLINNLSDTYGLQIQLNSPSVGERRASGSVPIAQDPEKLIENIALLYEVKVTKEQGIFILR